MERKWSDHLPIPLVEDNRDFGPKSFKFFDSWLSETGIEELVANAWRKEVHSTSPDGIFRDKLKHVKTVIREWAKKKFGNLEVDLLKAKEEFVTLEKETESQGWDEGKREV